MWHRAPFVQGALWGGCGLVCGPHERLRVAEKLGRVRIKFPDTPLQNQSVFQLKEPCPVWWRMSIVGRPEGTHLRGVIMPDLAYLRAGITCHGHPSRQAARLCRRS